MEKRVKILIVDDSPVSRDLLSFIIQSDSGLEVVGTAVNGEEAVAMAASLKPDVIMMDIVMPKMNGFDATKSIMKANPTPIIIVSGVFNKDEITKAFDAINAGAITIIEKPKGVGDSQYLDTARFVIESIKALAMIKISQFKDTATSATSVQQKTGTSGQPIDIIAIGASIGGPQALSQILSQLPGTFPTPILVSQHISNGFTEGFGQWLSATTKLVVQVAVHKEKAKPGHVYLAPDKKQLTINEEGLLIVEELSNERLARSSINTLFHSVARSYGSRGVGILLTGIGSDGIEGLKAIKDARGVAIVQDPDSTILPDLPKAAIEAGASTQVESLSKIPITLKLLTQKPALKL